MVVVVVVVVVVVYLLFCLFVLFLFFVCWLVPICLLPVTEGPVLLDKDVSRRLIRLIVLIV